MEIYILVLLLVFQVKHLVADYFLQFPYMYENKGKATGWARPLFDHAAVHGGFTWLIAFVFIASMTDRPLLAVSVGFMIASYDFTTHFLIDRWKATQKTDPSQSWFWESLGIDQMLHHIVGITIIAYMGLYYA